MRRIFAPLFTTCLITACANSPALEVANAQEAATSGGGGVIASSVKVKTNTNGLLGYALEVDQTGLIILTTTGWIVDLGYDGSISPWVLFFSNAGCTGTAYRDSSRPMHGKSIFLGYDGSYYKPASSPANQSSASATYNSARTQAGCSAMTYTGALIPLTTSTGPTEAGLPATITGPIVLEAP